MANTLAELRADLLLVDLPNSDFDTLKINVNDRWGAKLNVFLVI